MGEVFPLIPQLETARLLLDSHRVEDFEDLAAMWGDQETVRYIFNTPSSRGQSWSRLLCYRGMWPVLGYGYWAVREKSSGEYIGDLGFADFRRDIQPPLDGIPEAGWVLKHSAHGRGFASEALAAATAWLDRTERFQKACCIVSPDNKASLRVAEKAGFLPTGTAIFGGDEVSLHIRHTPDRS